MLELGLILLFLASVVIVIGGFIAFMDCEEEVGIAFITVGIFLTLVSYNAGDTINKLQKSLVASQESYHVLSTEYKEVSEDYESLLQSTKGYQETLEETQKKLNKAYAVNEGLKTQVAIKEGLIQKAKYEYTKATGEMVVQINKVTAMANETGRELSLCENTKEAYEETNSELRDAIYKASVILGNIK